MDDPICSQGFTILRKDGKNHAGGGVAVLCRNEWTLQEIPLLCNEFECLWTEAKTSIIRNFSQQQFIILQIPNTINMI